MRSATRLLRQAVGWPCLVPWQRTQALSTATREQLLDRLRRAKADELAYNQPPKNMWEDRQTWVLVAGLAVSLGWGFSILRGYSVTDHVYMDIQVGGQPAGRLVLALHGQAVPRATANFVDLATHKCGYGYKGSSFYEVIPNFAIMGGDITKGDGSGGVSALGPSFPKEKSNIPHGRGTLSMITDNDYGVRSQFFICASPTRSYSAQLVAFGKVVEGMDVVDRLTQLPTDQKNRPSLPITITECGTLTSDSPSDGSWLGAIMKWFWS